MEIDLTTIMPFAIFGAITVGLFAVMSFFSKGDSRATERLDELRDPAARDKKKGNGAGIGKVLAQAAPTMAKALESKSELERNELLVRMANAGFNQPGAAQIYLAIKLLALAVGALLGGGYGFLAYGATQKGMVSIAVGGGIGFYLPELVLRFLVSARKQKIFLSLPDALDLLVVCVEAGLGLDAGLRKIGDELKDVHPEMCSELELANMQVQMGRPRRDVLHDLGVRTGVDDMKSLAAILIQAERFGSSIAQALRVQSDSMRTKRKQLAEEKAQKTAVQMLIPMVLFIFPGIFVVLVGPAAIRIMDQMTNQ